MKIAFNILLVIIVLGLIMFSSYRYNAELVSSPAHPIPVAVFHRFAPDGSGPVLQIQNNSQSDLTLEITFTSGSSKNVRTSSLSLSPGELKEVGHGFDLAPGDNAQISAEGFDTLETGL